MERPDFLNKKYPDLVGSRPVARAVEKAKQDPERVFTPHSRDERIQAYLSRLDHIITDERGWELLKKEIVKEFVINTNDEEALSKIAHGLYESEKKQAIEQGRGADIERLEGEVQQEGGVIERYKGLAHEKQEIQEKSLSTWLDYLQQNDAQYPLWFRYFIVRNLQKMGTLNKEKGEYSKRTHHTLAPFPELNSEALGFVYRMFTTGIGHQEFVDEDEKRSELATLIEKKDFIRLYTFAQIETAGQLNRESLQGEWHVYPQGSDPHILENALRGKGTGWCTAEGSAYSQLQGGDFYVYFTRGTGGAYSEPRIAIRMEGESVAEVRGVNHRQELEPALVDIATEKYHSFPGGERFDKKSADMKQVTALVDKQNKNEPFTKADLQFLYELNAPIEGFGYEKDPRIAELRNAREVDADLSVLLECQPEQIAHHVAQITPETKAYVGLLRPGIFDMLPQTVEHIYTKFPEARIKFRTVELGTGIKNGKEFKGAIENSGMRVDDWAEQILRSPEFNVVGQHANADLVEVSVASLGFPDDAANEEIWRAGQDLGLDLCPAEVGPQLRLQYKEQPLDEWLIIAMKAIHDAVGHPNVFAVARDDDGLWLGGHNGHPSCTWNPDFRFVFLCPRKS